MTNRFCASLLLLGAGAVQGFGQTGSTSQSEKTLDGTVTGTLRRISATDLVLQSNDQRVVKIALGVTTKFYRSLPDAGARSGGPPSTAKLADFQPGDQLSIDYFELTPSYFRATKIALVKQGTPADRAQALQPVEVSPAPAAASSKAAAAAATADTSHGGSDSVNSRATLQRQPPVQSNPPTEARLPDPEPAQPLLPAPSRAGVDPVIESAREAAFEFSQTLPNYIVQQHTNRYWTQNAHATHTSWQTIDTVTADVICEDGKESYKNILVNGRPPTESPEDTGAWSTGEYLSLQLDLLADNTNADFHNRRSDTIVNRAAYLYDFTVQQPNSHWSLHALGQEYMPAYSGSIWIDKENSRVLRIELSAQKLERTFPLDTVESAVDYDYVTIGDGKYLLPAHSESISCKRGSGLCDRNVIDFRNYRKFTADTNIKFGPDQ